MKKDLASLDEFDGAQLGAKIKAYGIKAPDTGNDLSDPYPFNLMFATSIGPTGLAKGYVRRLSLHPSPLAEFSLICYRIKEQRMQLYTRTLVT